MLAGANSYQLLTFTAYLVTLLLTDRLPVVALKPEYSGFKTPTGQWL